MKIRTLLGSESWSRFGAGRPLPCLLVIILGIAAVLTPAAWGAVGSFIQVEGPVEVLRQGAPPALPAKIKDGVDKGDLVRTKSGGRAQIRFVDDTTLTIAPGSALVIEEYLYDAPRGARQASLSLLRGLTYTVVDKVLKTEEPDFLIKTSTAIFGVRGTRFFVLAAARFNAGYNEQGRLEAASRDRLQKALLMGMEFVTAVRGRPLSPVQRLSLADLNTLRQWLVTGVPESILTGDPPFMSLTGPPVKKFPTPDLPQDLRDEMFVPPTPKPRPPHNY
uniref:FecR protein domain-containing protein n=1 Tax=Desulfobacca acetoxidans TaxID=60893 RepID=A0A7V4LDD7_9BACT